MKEIFSFNFRFKFLERFMFDIFHLRCVYFFCYSKTRISINFTYQIKIEEFKNSKFKNLILSNYTPLSCYICFIFVIQTTVNFLEHCMHTVVPKMYKNVLVHTKLNCSTGSPRTPNGLRNLSWGNY